MAGRGRYKVGAEPATSWVSDDIERSSRLYRQDRRRRRLRRAGRVVRETLGNW